jgi:DnaJ homolog subfamily C member 10
MIYVVLIALHCLTLSVHSGEDFYQLLGITKSATQRDIRRAFKSLALEKHPDKRTVGIQRHEYVALLSFRMDIL